MSDSTNPAEAVDTAAIVDQLQRDIDGLQNAQAELSAPADAYQRQAAVARRTQLEKELKHRLDQIERLREEVNRMHARQLKIRLDSGESERLAHEARYLAAEIGKKLEEIQKLVARAKEFESFARPRIETCLLIERGVAAEQEP